MPSPRQSTGRARGAQARRHRTLFRCHHCGDDKHQLPISLSPERARSSSSAPVAAEGSARQTRCAGQYGDDRADGRRWTRMRPAELDSQASARIALAASESRSARWRPAPAWAAAGVTIPPARRHPRRHAKQAERYQRRYRTDRVQRGAGDHAHERRDGDDRREARHCGQCDFRHSLIRASPTQQVTAAAVAASSTLGRPGAPGTARKPATAANAVAIRLSVSPAIASTIGALRQRRRHQRRRSAPSAAIAAVAPGGLALALKVFRTSASTPMPVRQPAAIATGKPRHQSTPGVGPRSGPPPASPTRPPLRRRDEGRAAGSRTWLRSRTAPSQIPFCANVFDGSKVAGAGMDSWYRFAVQTVVDPAGLEDVDDRRESGRRRASRPVGPGRRRRRRHARTRGAAPDRMQTT